MTNLIENARSFSEDGGEVRVALRRIAVAADADADADLDDPRERILITVEDDGPGIPPHALERIFQRFYTDRPNQGFGQNSGLGLSISRQIVEAHGGRIWAANRPAEPVSVRGAEPTHDDPGESARHGAGARFGVGRPAYQA